MNIFGKKPKLAPPSGLPEPDINAVTPIFDKHSDAFIKFEATQQSDFQTLVKVKDALDTAIFFNFNSISCDLQ